MNDFLRMTALAIFAAFGAAVPAWSMGDRFPYEDGNVVTTSGGLWSNWANRTPSTPVNVAGQALELSASRTDSVARPLPPHDGVLYVRFKLNVSAVPDTAGAEYFLCFKDAADNRRGRVFIQRTTTTTFHLGVAFAKIGSVPTDIVWTLNKNQNTDYTVVIRLDAAAKKLKMWVDQTSETGTSIESTDTSSTISYEYIALRQSSQYGGIGTMKIDDMVVGETWGEVVGPIYDVTDYGATPDNGNDNDGEGMRAAITAARSSGTHAILFFPTGIYRVTGQATESAGGEATVMYFNNIDNNLVVDGSGSTIVMTHETNADTYLQVQPMYFSSCDGTTVKDLVVDWARPSFTVGTVGQVTDLGASGSYTRQWQFPVTVDQGYPIPDTSATWAVKALTDMDPVSGRPLCNISVFDNSTPNKDTLSWSLDAERTEYTITVRTTTTGGANVEGQMRLDHLDLAMAQLPGKKVVLRHNGDPDGGIYGPQAIYFNACTGVVVKDVTIHTSMGMGIRFNQSTDVTLRGTSLQPSNGRLLSTPADGTFFAFCKGNIVFDRCNYEATGDDSINVHPTKFLRISDDPLVAGTQADGTLLSGASLAAGAQDGSSSGPLPSASSQYEFYTKDAHAPYLNGSDPFLGTVSGTPSQNGTTFTLSFTSLPSGLKVGDYILKKEERPAVTVDGCTFNGGLCRGVILSTEDAVITDSVFENIAFNGVMLLADPAQAGCQGPACKDVVIDGCEFAGCGAAPIAVVSPSGGFRPRPSATGFLQNLTVTNNTFSPESDAAINALRLARSTTGGAGETVRTSYAQAALYLMALAGTNVIQNNVFGGTGPDDGFAPAVSLNHVSGLQLLNNVVPGQNWRRCKFTQTSGYDPVPDFGATPTGTPPDYLVGADQELIDGSGNPTTNDNSWEGYIRQLGDVRQ